MSNATAHSHAHIPSVNTRRTRTLAPIRIVIHFKVLESRAPIADVVVFGTGHRCRHSKKPFFGAAVVQIYMYTMCDGECVHCDFCERFQKHIWRIVHTFHLTVFIQCTVCCWCCCCSSCSLLACSNSSVTLIADSGDFIRVSVCFYFWVYSRFLFTSCSFHSSHSCSYILFHLLCKRDEEICLHCTSTQIERDMRLAVDVWNT